jgi:formate hydrogenlyase subunit 6/NADH:ubiquinone oxidoreductase subunit I
MSFPGKMAAQVISGGLFHKPATLLYPYEKATMPKGFRGRLIFYPERCVFCKLCMKDCPSEAIQINKLGEKQYQAIVNLGRCLFCGQCTLSCNKDALEMSTNYELATTQAGAMSIDIGRDPKAEGGVEAECVDDEVPGPEGPHGAGPAAKAGD